MGEPTGEEWAKAAWMIQSWVRSCYDQMGYCVFCAAIEASPHIPGCPWPQTRALLDRTAVSP
jgi:hypothetical protein